MLVIAALGGNALLRRGEPLTAENQRLNVQRAAPALAAILRAGHQLVITHGNGPQVGLLALQGAAYKPDEAYPLDVLGAETEGMIGYLIEQELMNALPDGAQCATLLTRVEVDRTDPAFDQPTKPIGPVYTAEEAKLARAEHLWSMVSEPKGGLRRVVPSPLPQRILGLAAIKLLVEAGICVICAGGGGIPVVRNDGGGMEGVEAVIDKDRTAALLAQELQADALLMLTDVAAVMRDWGGPAEAAIRSTTPDALDKLTFAAGSMGPKVAAAAAFVRAGGTVAGIGTLQYARDILEGRAGTQIRAATTSASAAAGDAELRRDQSASMPTSA